eukprot:gb/GECG01005932.1/.p1 GENE.gb/GECG01005932.1/~~gb/GECG01005932.1/.p1  ORF type:complete len:141 (+),score=14.77 gb/GECG01005932.1/:1-423(+)
MVGIDNSQESVLNTTGISNTLEDIQGQLYHYEGVQKWENETWTLNGSDNLPILRFQLVESPAHTLSAAPGSSGTPTGTPSASMASTASPSHLASPTGTRTSTHSLKPNSIPSKSPCSLATKRTLPTQRPPRTIKQESSKT